MLTDDTPYIDYSRRLEKVPSLAGLQFSLTMIQFSNLLNLHIR